MRLIEIKTNENGSHSNKTTFGNVSIPDGWAVIPDSFGELQNFPFGEITIEEINGVLTVTGWTPGEMPEPEPVPEPVEPEPTADDVLNALLGVTE